MDASIQFRFRTVGIARHEDCVLLHRADFEDFWSLPGGGVESGETAPEALVREMREELGVEVTVGRLLVVMENLFTYNGVRYHGLGLYFEMSFPNDCPLLQTTILHTGIESDFNNLPAFQLVYEWVPVSDLDGRIIKPAPIVPVLKTPPDTIRYVINNELRESR